MSLDFFDNILLQDFALKAPQCAFKRFAALDVDFSQ
jgi:hypothetical protein